jgi:hypothetical protein
MSTLNPIQRTKHQLIAIRQNPSWEYDYLNRLLIFDNKTNDGFLPERLVFMRKIVTYE